eukprot:CAMPEP_0114409722 /NCGR_PEP_ID=MMETSP0102-20121206/23575_1 /TAXON_ID=38822 ORGANISM="Pteridomonas danica, Strain PT" /NCGR_SAMPLE_ID=MMETSP0102 /ASSEMBLY_ACC=CAM_ASM_000212 /LENGTH=103 /DNA_ID=CAMNT_0001577171 /DNA_START=356 /DNA_END=664 /DNA_ORIENTATION=+
MEAEHQLIQFQNQNFIDIILSNDLDLLPFGAREMIVEWKVGGIVYVHRSKVMAKIGDGNLSDINLARYCASTECDYVARPKATKKGTPLELATCGDNALIIEL